MLDYPRLAYRGPSNHTVQFITVDKDVRLEVLDCGGPGRLVILLAGYLTAHAYRPHSSYTARESGEDVLRVIDALELEAPVLAGHSFGGQDLLTLGATHPERIARHVCRSCKARLREYSCARTRLFRRARSV